MIAAASRARAGQAVTVIETRAGADEVIGEVIGESEQMLGTTRCSVGGTLTYLPEPPSSNRIEALLRPTRSYPWRAIAGSRRVHAVKADSAGSFRRECLHS